MREHRGSGDEAARQAGRRPLPGVVITGAVLAILLGVFLTDLPAVSRALLALVAFGVFYALGLVAARHRP